MAVLLSATLWVALSGQGVPENAFNVEVGPSGFKPVAVVIPAGKPATLRVRNASLASAPGSAPHRFAIGELGIDVKLEPGQTTVINLMPLQPATYHYICDICCGGGSAPAMQGALIVH
jgi:heme/copper-type cytochrome/quinol oxidase subunit 2